MPQALTEKQLRFCNEYLVDYNATQAAIRAGFSKKTAHVQGHQLLNKTLVQQYLQSKKEKVAERLEINQERTLREIGRIAFQDARKFYDEDGDLIPIHKLDADTAAAVSGMDIEEMFQTVDGERLLIGQVKKIKRFDKTRALEMLAKHFKIFSDAPVTNNDIKIGYGKEE